jgi:holo-[acyl-carrier protein] synthase
MSENQTLIVRFYFMFWEPLLIVGMGTDVFEVERTADAIARHGRRYLDRLFTPAELSAGDGRRDAAAFFARRFAAKEACAKALGTGITASVRWLDIEISNDALGAPRIALSGGALRRMKWLLPRGRTAGLYVSLATADGIAVATVILEARTDD